MKKSEAKKRGRPAGSRNVARQAVTAEPSRCRRCGSTNRTPYAQTTVQEYAGRTPDGKPYTHIIRRWTSCAACGQARIDITRENRLAPSNETGNLSAGS